MWLSSSLAYWASLGIVGYTYAGYPLLVGAVARIRPRRVKRAAIEPQVTIILAARNEARNIARKLDNLLSLDYPSHKIQIVVVDDGSTDGTSDIVREYENVSLVRLDGASGKPTAINRGFEQAVGEVVVFCDVRQRLDRGALRAIVPLFADPEVGVVSGELSISGNEGPGAYWRYERWIRRAESRIGSVPGATGAFFAVRRHLFSPLPADTLLDDVYTPMRIVLQGYRALVEPTARIYDSEATTAGEFARKSRTLAGNFQLLAQLPRILDPRANRIWPQFVSHKLLRLVCPFALCTLFLSNVVLVVTGAPGWPLYFATLLAQGVVYGSALVGLLRGARAGKVARLSRTFVVLNAAAIDGLRRYVQGDLAWTTERSYSAPAE